MLDADTPAADNPPCAWFTADATCGTLAIHSTLPTVAEGDALETSCARPR